MRAQSPERSPHGSASGRRRSLSTSSPHRAASANGEAAADAAAVGTPVSTARDTEHRTGRPPSSKCARGNCFRGPVAARLRARLPQLLSLAHWALLTLLSALYALTCNSALRIFACSEASVTVRAYLTALVSDGTVLARLQLPLASSFSSACLVSQCADLAQLAALNRVIPVPVLDSDPAVVCWEARHAPAAALAGLTLVLYTLGLPLCSVLWLRWRIGRLMSRGATRSAWDAAQAADAAARRAFTAARAKRCTAAWLQQRLLLGLRMLWHCGLPHSAAADPEAVPVQSGRASRDAAAATRIHHDHQASSAGLLGSLDAAVSCNRYCARRALRRADATVDADAAVRSDSSIAFFAAASAELRPAAATFRHAQWASVALLSVAAVLWRPAVSTPAGQAAKGLLCAAGLVALAHAGGAIRPFAPAHRWKAGLQYAITLLAAGGCALNAVNAITNPEGKATAGPAVTALSIALVACGAALVAALLATFFREMVLGAKAEAAAAAAARRAAGGDTGSQNAGHHPLPGAVPGHSGPGGHNTRPAADTSGGDDDDDEAGGSSHGPRKALTAAAAAAGPIRARRPEPAARPAAALASVTIADVIATASASASASASAASSSTAGSAGSAAPSRDGDNRTARASMLKRDFARQQTRDREGLGGLGLGRAASAARLHELQRPMQPQQQTTSSMAAASTS